VPLTELSDTPIRAAISLFARPSNTQERTCCSRSVNVADPTIVDGLPSALSSTQSAGEAFSTVSASGGNWLNFARRREDTERLPGRKCLMRHLHLSHHRVCQTGSVYRKFSTRIMSLSVASHCV
jgi:hypothetical protein